MSSQTISTLKSLEALNYFQIIKNISVEKKTLQLFRNTNPERGLPVEKGMLDVCVAQLVRAVDRQARDSSSNPGTVESVSFSTKQF